MKRLVKKSKHDAINRDFAILYINGIFYEDITHAMCLKQFIDQNNLNDILTNYQKRPDMDIFIEISEQIGPVVLAHNVEKENGIFVIYGVENGRVLDFDSISNNLLEDIKNHYNMEVYDDMNHINQNNPYADEKSNKSDELFSKSFELSGYPGIIDSIKAYGFSVKNNSAYEKDGMFLLPIAEDVNFKLIIPGNKIKTIQPDNIEQELNNLNNYDLSIVEYLKNCDIRYNLNSDYSLEIKGELINQCYIELDSGTNGKIYLYTFEDPYGDDAMREARLALNRREIGIEELKILSNLDLG
jgi:hypothetical protein